MNLTDISTFLAVLARVAGWMHAAPFIGEKMVPAKVRMAAVILMSLLLTPAHPPIAADELIMILPAELLLGLIAGFAARLAVGSRGCGPAGRAAARSSASPARWTP